MQADFTLPMLHHSSTPTQSFNSLWERGMLRQPEHVPIVRCCDAKWKSVVVADGCLGAGINPFFDFTMTVRKGEAASPIVVAGGPIKNVALRRIFQV